MKISVFTLLFSFLVAVPVYAAASPSNADEQLQDEIPLINDLGSEVDDNANDSGYYPLLYNKLFSDISVKIKRVSA